MNQGKEGLDRGDMRLADNQIELLKAVQQANPNTVVVLSAGASLETPWLKHCRTLVYGAAARRGGRHAGCADRQSEPQRQAGRNLGQRLCGYPRQG